MPLGQPSTDGLLVWRSHEVTKILVLSELKRGLGITMALILKDCVSTGHVASLVPVDGGRPVCLTALVDLPSPWSTWDISNNAKYSELQKKTFKWFDSTHSGKTQIKSSGWNSLIIAISLWIFFCKFHNIHRWKYYGKMATLLHCRE